MQGIILAAGSANRLKPLTKDCPKCLLNIGNTNIIERTIRNLAYYGIKDFVIVVGFKAEMLKTYVTKNLSEFNYTFVHNENYASTNNAYSLALTKQLIENDFLLLDSDILFQKEIIKKILDSGHNCVLAYNKAKCDEEEMKVQIDNANKVIEISKEIEPEKAVGESIGIEYFDNVHKKLLFEILEKRLSNKENLNEYYEASFKEMIDNGIDFYGIDISEYKSMEIDFVQDIYSAEKEIIPFLED